MEDNNKTSAKCKDCNCEVSAKVLRLKSHRQKCQGQKKPETVAKRPFEEMVSEPETPNDQPTAKRQKLQQTNFSSYAISTDCNLWKQLDEQIARLFYACNLPFNIADHPMWKETIGMLRPGYTPPDRKEIGGHLLDEVHEKLTTKMKTELQGKDVVMMQDGWSDIHNAPVIATSLHSEGLAYFLLAVDTGTNKKTAAYCTSIAKDAMTLAQEEYGCKVIGIVTDNEKKMEVMKTSLKEADQNLSVYGCSAHWLNLLGQDITPSQVISQVVEVSKHFRNHHVPGTLLNEISGSVKPQLPAETRCNSQLKCIETFIRNRPFMMLIVAQNEELIETRIQKILHNVGLFNEVKNLHTQLHPISAALDKLQSDSATIADACETWLDLLQSTELEPYCETVDKRFRQAMTPTHYLANLLHPVFRGKKLDSDHINSAQEMMLEQNADVVPELLSFMSNSITLPKALTHQSVIEKIKPNVWWSSVERSKTVNQDLCLLAMKILSN